MDQREVLRKRTGAKAAAKVFAARPGHLNVEHPLEVVQIDHTPADIILVDHVERSPLNRPFLTLAIDVATRIILGAYVSFDPPSVLSVALCLDHCVRPKSVQVPNTLEELAWPTSGIPKAIFVDNGQEFHSAAFKLACEEWGIGIEYRPAGGAHYGGHIERLIGTTMGAVHVLPGTTQSSTLEKGDYDSSKHAALTLSEFEDWLHLEICRYHNSTHSALGRTPLAAWADLGGDDAGRRVVDTEAFRISFMPLERRRLGRAGITLFSVGYWSDAFAQMIGRIKGKVVVKYDPRDLSQVWVILEDGRAIVARYKDLNHPQISLWENRRARKQCLAKSVGRVTEAMLFQVIGEQRRIAETARKQTRAAKLDNERDARQSKKHRLPRDPSREMFAIDTGNPDLPTVPIRLSPTPTTSRVLPVARVKLGVSGSGDIASDSEQGPEGVERAESPVEAECELVEVGLEVLVAHAVMNATQPRLQVGEDAMNDRQILLSDLGVASLGDGEVFVAALGEAGIAGPIVGDDRRTRSNGALDKAAERFRAAVWHDSESDTSGVATALPLIELGSRLALSHFNGAGDKKLVVNAPALAARAAADPGFVDFDMVAGLAADAVLIRPNHTSAELVEDLKGGFVTGKPDLALELCGRHAGRLAGNQIGRPEPYAQRRMGALHDRPRRQPGVAAALSTAQDAGPAGEAERLCRRLAMGADEPVTPPRLLQVGGTGRVIREKSLKLGKRPRKRKVFALRNIHPRFVRLPSHSTPHPTYSGCG